MERAASSAAASCSSVQAGSKPWVRAWDHDLQLLGPLGRHGQEIGDDLERHGEGEVADQLRPAGVGGAVEGGVDQLLDAGPQPVDGARGEGGLDKAAQAGVVGRVEPRASTGPAGALRSWRRRPMNGPGVALVSRSRLNTGSRSARATSAYRVSTTRPIELRWTGSSSRRVRYDG